MPAPIFNITQIEPLTSKQDTLVSGSNIKTINGNSVLGSGDISINSVDESAVYNWTNNHTFVSGIVTIGSAASLLIQTSTLQLPDNTRFNNAIGNSITIPMQFTNGITVKNLIFNSDGSATYDGTDITQGGSGLTAEQSERLLNVGVKKFITIDSNVTLDIENFDPSTTPDRGKEVWNLIDGDRTITVPSLSTSKTAIFKAGGLSSVDFLADTGVNFQIGGETILRQAFNLSNYSTVALTDIGGNVFSVDGDVSAFTLIDTEAPTVPTSLTNTTQGETTLTFTWAASTDNVGVTGYFGSIDDGADIDLGNVTSYQLIGLTGSTSYDFKVKAYDAAGNQSAFTANVQGTTDAPALSYPNQSNPNTEYVDDHAWSFTNNQATVPGTFTTSTNGERASEADITNGFTSNVLRVFTNTVGDEGRVTILTNTLLATLTNGVTYDINVRARRAAGDGSGGSVQISGGLFTTGLITDSNWQNYNGSFTFISNRTIEIRSDQSQDSTVASALDVLISIKEQ